jgi:hypothetical protein
VARVCVALHYPRGIVASQRSFGVRYVYRKTRVKMGCIGRTNVVGALPKCQAQESPVELILTMSDVC